MIAKHSRGFTLMEVLIASAIVGVLLAIAIPHYNGQVLKGRRADAKTSLLGVAQLQETYYANYRQYASKLGDNTDFSTNTLGCVTSCQTSSGKAISPEGYYELSIVQDNSQRYLIKATAKGKQADDTKCKYMAVDSRGRKGASSSDISKVDSDNPDPHNCW